MGETLDKILTVFGGKTDSISTGIGYRDVKPFLDRFLKSIDKERLGVEAIVLYGSIARGTGRINTCGSDRGKSGIDLLFITKNDLDDEMHNELVEKADQYTLPLFLDLELSGFSIYTITEDEFNGFAKVEHDGIKINGVSRRGGFMYNVADDGRILYDANGRITKYLRHMREEPHQKNLIVRGIVGEEIYPF